MSTMPYTAVVRRTRALPQARDVLPRTAARLLSGDRGMTTAEIAALTQAGATAVRLGPTVLRTSTAAAVAIAARIWPLRRVSGVTSWVMTRAEM